MRISSIECGRVVAILAVMTIHLSPFSNPRPRPVGRHALPSGGRHNQLCRFGAAVLPVRRLFLQPASPRATR